MKAVLRGYEPIDYVNKNGEPKRGCNLYFTAKLPDVYGEVTIKEYISATSPIFQRAISPRLAKLCDETSDIFGKPFTVDYISVDRGGRSYSQLADIQF